MEILERIAEALQQGDDQQVGRLAAEALAAGVPAGEVLQRGLVAGMNVVGEQFRLREIFLPDVLLSARAMYAGLDVLKPHLASEGVVSRGKVVLAKPGKMRWTYEEPERSLVVSDGHTLWLFDPAFGEVQKIPAGEGFLTGAAAQFLLGAGDMKRDFAVTAVSCDASEAELELVLREPATYERAFLRVNPSTGEVLSTRIVDLLGNVVRVDFRDLRFNTSPGESEFRFQVPEGVKVIELDP